MEELIVYMTLSLALLYLIFIAMGIGSITWISYKYKNDRIYYDWVWYDFWIGLYYDRENTILYFCPIPCFVIMMYIGERYE